MQEVKGGWNEMYDDAAQCMRMEITDVPRVFVDGRIREGQFELDTSVIMHFSYFSYGD